MMVNDYSRRCSSVFDQRQQVLDRRVIRDAEETTVPRFAGAVVCLLLLIGIGASFLVNARIETRLAELGQQVERQKSFSDRNRQLEEGHRTLLLADAMARKAEALGLVQDKGQIISMR